MLHNIDDICCKLFTTTCMRLDCVQKIRCVNVHPFGLNDPSLTVKLCRLCSFKTKVFSPIMQAKDTCAVCGTFISPNMCGTAKLCMQHRPQGAMPNMDKCISCNQYIGGALAPSVPAQLCHMCNSNGMRCCKLLI